MATSIAFDIFARDRASKTFDSTGNAAERSGRKLQRMGRLAKVAGLGLAGGFVAASAAAVNFAKAAVEDETSAKKLARQLRNSAGATRAQVAATEDWISRQGVAKGVADDDLRPALATLVRSTNDVGKAQRLASLAMDVSAGTGKSLSTVSTALAKAQKGNVSGLGRLGIATKDAHGKTLSLQQITAQLSKTFKGQADVAANTTAGKFARFKLAMSEAGEAIGYKLLPPLTAAASWMVTTGIPMVEKYATIIGSKLGPAFRAIGGFVDGTVLPAWRRLTAGGQASSGVMSEFGRNFSSIWTSVRSIFTSVSGFAQAFWGRFGGYITSFAQGTLRNLITQVRGALNVVTGIFKTVAAVLRGDWGGAWGGIKQIVRGAWQVIRGTVAQGWNIVRTLFRAGGSALRGIMSAAWSGIVHAVSAGASRVAQAAGRLPGKIKAGLGNLGGLLVSEGGHIISGLVQGMLSRAASAIPAAVSSVVNKIPSKVRSLLGIHSPSRVMMRLGRFVSEGLARGIIGGGRLIDDAVKRTVSRVTAMRSKLADAQRKLADVLSQRKQFAAGFNQSQSVFGADYGDTGPTAGSILQKAMDERAKASGVQVDVAKLLKLGLSTSLIKQMQANGDTATMHAIAATGSRSYVAQLNALDKKTQASYSAAGMAAGNRVYGGQIDRATEAVRDRRRQLRQSEELLRVLRKLERRIADDKHTYVYIDGKKVIAVTNKATRQQGKK